MPFAGLRALLQAIAGQAVRFARFAGEIGRETRLSAPPPLPLNFNNEADKDKQQPQPLALTDSDKGQGTDPDGLTYLLDQPTQPTRRPNPNRLPRPTTPTRPASPAQPCPDLVGQPLPKPAPICPELPTGHAPSCLPVTLALLGRVLYFCLSGKHRQGHGLRVNNEQQKR